MSDQKLRLIARMMLRDILMEEKNEHLLFKWKNDKNNKPFIDSWDSFSISHSGDVAVICVSSQSVVGVDIEKKTNLHVGDIIEFFTKEERVFIERSNCTTDAFYDIWVRKEAILKALGKGIAYGLDGFSCIKDIIYLDEAAWYFRKILISNEYVSYLCSSKPIEEISLKEFSI